VDAKGELVPCHSKNLHDSKFDKGWSTKLRESSSALVEKWKPSLPIFQSPHPELKDAAVQLT